MKSNVLVVGSVALDTVKTPFGSVREALGGSATFFGASARFFSDVSLVAVVGRDFPARHRALIRRLGIDDSGLVTEAGKTFRWKGYYDFNLNTAHTLKTELNVFQTFKPVLSPRHRAMRDVFLANIDPELQLSVLSQVRKPDLVACDTMNYWINSKKDLLLELLRHIDILMVNDTEARELSGDWNIYRAAHWILQHGPERVVIKQGEHGALLVDKDATFKVPAYPLQEVFDPTGAGDAFAGGFMGYIASVQNVSTAALRRAMVHGAAMGSFAVEGFGIQGFDKVTPADVRARVRAFKDLIHFELD
jgi:sugar/nucleoside kinase (ribokinase family)